MPTVYASNSTTILRAIGQVCVAQRALMDRQPVPFTGYKLFSAPSTPQLQDAGTPFLSVGRPRLVGYAVAGSEGGGPDAVNQPGIYEPIWDFEVYAWFPYDEDNPNYDDANDTINGIAQALISNPFLPYTSSVEPEPAPTTTTFAVSPGDGRRVALYTSMSLDGVMTAPVLSVAGDVITLASPMPAPPAPGAVASQSTCGNSYPYNTMPDYAQLTDGGPWCVGYTIVRASEQLIREFP